MKISIEKNAVRKGDCWIKKTLFRLSVAVYFVPMFFFGAVLSVLLFPILVGVIGAKDILTWYENKFKEDMNG